MTGKATKHLSVTNDIILRIGSIADEVGVEAYVVGGYVRDQLFKKINYASAATDDGEMKDIDIVVIGDGISFANTTASKMGKKQIITYEKFGTAMLQLDDRKVEFVTAREERYEPSSRKPRVKKASLQSDLSRRDFTINALAVAINGKHLGEIVDPFDGEDDIRKKILRTPLDPEQTFDDDPLRMMRAIRFASRFRFHIEERTLEAIRNKASRITIVSVERTTDEFLKILATPVPSIGIKLLLELGLTKYLFPELDEIVGVQQRKDYHHKDVFLHTMKVIDNICDETDNLWLRFTALVHDIAKPRTKAFVEGVGWTFHGHDDLGARMMKSIFRRMKFPMDKLPYVEKLIRLHLRPMVLVSEEITDSAVRRLLFEAGDAIDDLVMLCRADITSQNPERVTKYLKNYEIVLMKMKEVEEKDRLRNWQPPIRGNEIMDVCNIQPGPLVGILKKKIEEAILDGLIPNEHDSALIYLLSIKNQVLQKYS